MVSLLLSHTTEQYFERKIVSSHDIFLFHSICKKIFPRSITGLYNQSESKAEAISFNSGRFVNLEFVFVADQTLINILSLSTIHVRPRTFILSAFD